MPEAAAARRKAALPCAMLLSYALRISRVVCDRQMAAYRGSCSRSSARASAATTRSLPSRSTNHFTGSSYQQKFWMRC